jgi:hypothetical protein
MCVLPPSSRIPAGPPLGAASLWHVRVGRNYALIKAEESRKQTGIACRLLRGVSAGNRANAQVDRLSLAGRFRVELMIERSRQQAPGGKYVVTCHLSLLGFRVRAFTAGSQVGADSRFFALLGSASQELNTVRPEAKLTR